jgi:hypothetical protein
MERMELYQKMKNKEANIRKPTAKEIEAEKANERLSKLKK